jgi:6-phosphogluconolactonase
VRSQMRDRHEFFVGAYSSQRGKGVYPLSYSADQGWRLGPPESAFENASYAAYNFRHGVYYLLDESKPGRIRACRRNPAGEWRQISDQPSGGDAPCFVAINAQASALAVANYEGGAVAIYRLSGKSGELGGAPIVQTNVGRSVNAERQEGPHAHCALFAFGHVYNTDLGTDEVVARPYDPHLHVAGNPFRAFSLPPGQGPRHIVFHPWLRVAYLLTELASEIFVLAVRQDGTLQEIQRLPNLPECFEGESLGGHIAISASGERLYASNRGHDSISVYHVGRSGALGRLQTARSQGESPRFFRLVDDLHRIIVAHENDDSVIVLKLESDGLIGGRCARLDVPKPAFVGKVHH